MPKMEFPTAERRRKLQAVTVTPNTIGSRELPRDTVLKGLIFRLSGAITTTYASGTPVADAMSSFANIVPRIDVIVAGRTVKSVDPHMIQIQQLFTSVVQAERRASAGASAATDNYPTVDQGFVFGTTTQITTVAESLYLPFEHVYCEPGLGRELTWLNLKGVASAEVRFTFASYSAFQGYGNTAPVTYSASTLQIDITTKEAQDVPPELELSDWKQTVKTIPFSAETRDYAIDINRGNFLTGIMLYCRDGASGSATTASGKLASNLLVTKWALKLNGQSDVQAGDFKITQAENKMQYGVNAPMASNVSRLDGIAHINLLARKDLSTALDVRPPRVDNVQLVLDTNTSSNVTYTSTATVQVMTEELVPPR